MFRVLVVRVVRRISHRHDGCQGRFPGRRGAIGKPPGGSISSISTAASRRSDRSAASSSRWRTRLRGSATRGVSEAVEDKSDLVIPGRMTDDLYRDLRAIAENPGQEVNRELNELWTLFDDPQTTDGRTTVIFERAGRYTSFRPRDRSIRAHPSRVRLRFGRPAAASKRMTALAGFFSRWMSCSPGL
jgi:hypothetical protein